MSTNGAVDSRKRKPSDPNSGSSSPAPKQIKLDGSSMASAAPQQGTSQQQQHALQAMLSQQAMTDEQKRKYITGVESLRKLIEKKGPNSLEGRNAQAKIDQIFSHLRQLAQRTQAQHYQNQAGTPQGAGAVPGAAPTGANPNRPAVPPQGAGGAQGGQHISNVAQKWIAPLGLDQAGADKWRMEISAKLNTVGQKLSVAKAQIHEHNRAIEAGGLTQEIEQQHREKLQLAHQNYLHGKEILNKFANQQKALQAQRNPGAAAGAVMTQQQQQPAQATQMAQSQSQQGVGAAPTPRTMAVPGTQPGTQQNMMTGAGMAQPGNMVQQPAIRGPLPQPQPQQPQPQLLQQIPQRVSTPVDPGRAGSPNVNNALNAMNQARQQQAQAQQQQQNAMSPVGQPAVQMQPHQQVQAQQRSMSQGGMVPQNQPQQQAVGRSPAPINAGTPMPAGPNSPVPNRPGSVQPQTRPPTASGAPTTANPQQQGQMMPQSAGGLGQSPGMTMQRDANVQKMPIPKNLSVTQPTPVSMPPARPSLTGGANMPANQVLGTPAIIKQPAFEFDEGGMGLLSKRKLEELVKQIDPEEKLDPDVEESILELVDEFIDTIATTACKMAKLRGSDTLDIKDIQIILERNWNIRIPGYSADEIRTVRKFNPAPGYHQKISALMAQKQLAQTSAKGGD